ncbi:Uncharacterised protein [Mycobacteroides abscessus subsp. abscessus]|nr:Uncharacterised protein [Mycobacteroides abscessus subsp. abscessus]
MHVGLVVLGALVVDDVRDVVDVDSAGGHVGGHQHVDLTGPERCQRLFPSDLSKVTVHSADREATLGQLVGNLLGGALGAGEDHGGAPPVGLQNPADQFDLVQRVRAVHELLRGVVHRGGLRVLGANVRRAVHEGASQGDDRVRHGRREQHRLAARIGGRRQGQDAFDIGQEAQVQHFVGFVEDQHGQSAELQVPLLGQVQQAARGSDDYVGSGAQRLDLRLVGPSSVDGDDGEVAVARGQVLGGLGQVFVNLDAQLAGGHHDQGPRGAVERPVFDTGGDAVQQWDAERVRLAHAGAGLPDEVGAGQGKGECQFLDGKRMLNPGLAQCPGYFLAHAQLGKGVFDVAHVWYVPFVFRSARTIGRSDS